jgi:hypothetical protein
MEPILGGGKLFVATHNGGVYALNALTGAPIWRFQANGPFLQSPAYAEGRVVCASADGFVYALDAGHGTMRWRSKAEEGGFAAAPIVAGERVFIGSRRGRFLCLRLRDGARLWRRDLGAPVRQTAAYFGGKAFVASEDGVVHCLDGATGKPAWRSSPLSGQSARDYYPVIARSGSRACVIVRTNPVVAMPERIAEDRRLLCDLAGIDGSDWRTLDAWIKSDRARGNPELWEKERQGILRYLSARPEARSFFVLDAATGKSVATPPLLWIGGCQGVGTPPVPLPDSRWLVYYRSAYGNWSLGVAPLVALGRYDPATNRIEPLFHRGGAQPPWNAFWGTADESQNFVVAGDLVLIVHQSTLSGFDLKTGSLFPIRGERDTYGGYKNLPWARNEWNGPGRAGVAVDGERIYWQTGSRLLCLLAGESGPPAADVEIDGGTLIVRKPPALSHPSEDALRRLLAATTREILSRRWAPLMVQPGIAGREFFFDNSGDLFESLSLAYPYLPRSLQAQARRLLRSEWKSHPPYEASAWYPLDQGARREYFRFPKNQLSRPGSDRPCHPFGNLYAAWLYASRCGERKTVLANWPQLKAAFDDFLRSGWTLDGAEGDRYANRYLSSALAFVRLAEKAGDKEAARKAWSFRNRTLRERAAWWRKSAENARLAVFNGSADLDRFIGNGQGLFFSLAPHQAKLALFADLTPEEAKQIRNETPEAAERIWRAFSDLCPTWPLVGEERQVHYGENDIDPPDFSLDAFKAQAWLTDAPVRSLEESLDLPFCRADLFFAEKLSILLERLHRKG